MVAGGKRTTTKYSSSDSDYCLFAFHEQILNGWYVDSSAIAHMTMDETLFESLDEAPRRNVTIKRNGRCFDVLGIGQVNLSVMSAGKRTNIKLDNVLYVPDLQVSFLSVSAMVKKNFEVEFNKHRCLIKDSDGKIVCNATRSNGLYKLDVN